MPTGWPVEAREGCPLAVIAKEGPLDSRDHIVVKQTASRNLNHGFLDGTPICPITPQGDVLALGLGEGFTREDV